MKEYPLQPEDFVEMGRRMANKELCTIPIRGDIELRDGRIAENVLTWGSPRAYEIVRVPQLRDSLYYGRSKQ